MADVEDDSTLRFVILGRVQVWRGGTELDLGPRQQHQLLALLLLRAGAPVNADEVVDALWGDRPPASAANLIHRSIGNLRRIFEPGLPPRATGRWLTRAGTTYRLNVDEESLDLLRFRRLAHDARAAEEHGAPVAALRHYRKALDLWHGSCAAGLGEAIVNWPTAVAVNHERVRLLCAAAKTARDIGNGEDMLPTISAAAAEHPLNERVQSQFLLLLAATGRQADALHAYQSVRQCLADELGIDPGPELRAAYHVVLNQRADSAPGRRTTEGAHPVSVPPMRVKPDQLPPELVMFAGREDEIATLESFLDDQSSGQARTSIVAIDGLPGTGKTTLAVRWAHDVAARFPDGSLYVNLRGFSERREQLPVTEVLRGFLLALGVPGVHIPSNETAQSGLFRSLMSGMRMVVVLDNARDVAQVRPLLPGRSGCLVIVTSRNRLTGLVAEEGARLLTLRSLTQQDAMLALSGRLGAGRLAAEPEAASRIIQLCGRLPLAIALVAARAVAHPQFSLETIADSVAKSETLLDFGGDTDVEGVFSWSYRLLTPTAARLFRLFSLVPGADLSGDAAASLLSLSMRETQTVLNELTQSSLLCEHMPGRYSTHDLVFAYSRKLLSANESLDQRRQAIGRLLDFYLHNAYAAHKALGPDQPWSPPPPAGHDVIVRTTTDRSTAMAWFLLEYRVLIQAVGVAFDTGFLEHAWRMALTMHQFFQRQCLWHEWDASMRVALEAARLSGDRAGEADVTRSLAGANHFLRHYEESIAHLRRTAILYTELGRSDDWAHLERNHGTLLNSMGYCRTAIEHFSAALKLYREQAHRSGEAASLYGIATAHSKLHEPDQAIESCQQAMRIFEEIDDPTGAESCWSILAASYHLRKEFDKSIDGYQRAIQSYRMRGNLSEEAETLGQLAEAYLDSGARDAALAALHASLDIYQDLSIPHADDVRTRIAEVAQLAGRSKR